MKGPTVPLSEEVHATKYRGKGESFKEGVVRQAQAMCDDDEHFSQLKDIFGNMRFLPAGRVQAAMGSPRKITPYNCFVSGTIDDNMIDIMDKAKEAALTMQKGGGIGYDFSTIRPADSHISTLDSHASGPLSFMNVYDSVCATISSAGHRRGAQMAVLRIDHPDIEDFVSAKTNTDKLTNFNISIGVTDKFMQAVEGGTDFDLVFDGKVHRTINATALWDKVLRNTWDWAEPGILFIDRINNKNNLHYIENIAATNPCGEQPLPPYGACLLGSYNLTQYVIQDEETGEFLFDWLKFEHDIPPVVRAMDNVIDRAIYPLWQQEREAKDKRRMGLGITGLANAAEALGRPYGSTEFLTFMQRVLVTLRDIAYTSSVSLAIEKGAFPLYKEDYLDSDFAKTLPDTIRSFIREHGIRNSHLLSIAPTGTISLAADNISSGIEPVFSYGFDRTIIMPDGTRVERVDDYAYREWGVKGKLANECTIDDHVNVLCLASHYVDSACSKTCNVGDDVTWDQFKSVYQQAWKGGASGITTFRPSGKRAGVLTATADEDTADTGGHEEDITFGESCVFNDETNKWDCS